MNILWNCLCFRSRKFQKFQYLYPLIVSHQLISYLGRWEKPKGYDTGITIYNSSAKEKVPLTLKKKDLASWYMCGPTVYAESHIGHASCYVQFDIIRRILENVFNIRVFLLLGITDIDDKIIKKSSECGISSFQLAKIHELDFFQDMEAMRVLPPTAISHVTQNIPLIISFCEKLIEKGFAYITNEGNVYFMVSKGVTSEVLSEMPVENVQEVQRDCLKKDPRDFALWKAAKPNEPSWNSPWGNGRPGWHIECSAMASKMFGSNVDIHSGGYDLLFPHHANEVSQSQAYHSCSQWVNYWMHAGLLQVDDELKMSKSLGNTISIKNFLKEHYVNDFRILCLQSSYRKNILYSSDTLDGAKSLHKKIHNFMNDCESYLNGEIRGEISVTQEEKLLLMLGDTRQEIIKHLANDFNTAKALMCLTDFIDEVNKCLPITDSSVSTTCNSVSIIASSYFYVNEILQIFGILLVSKKKLPKDVLFGIDATVEFRNKIRSFTLNPNIIGNAESFSSYVDKIYNFMKLELNFIHKSGVHGHLFTSLSEDSEAFYLKTLEFVKILDTRKDLRLLEEMKLKEIRKVMSPLFSICDEFRATLYEKGIEIKDRGNFSTWIPLIELQKHISLSNI